MKTRKRLSVTAIVFLTLVGIVVAIGLYYFIIFYFGIFPS